jgi:hypothetical protein
MDGFGARVIGADAIRKYWATRAVAIQPLINNNIVHHAQILETRIKASASGRPGPNAPTGDYRRSWNTQLTMNGDQVVADVGTNKPQGRRLEFGFVGTDSLGRFYNQPPFPHVELNIPPVMDSLTKSIEAEVAKL